MRRHKDSGPALAALERQRQALELRRQGQDYTAIAIQLGYSGRQGAYKAVQSAMARVIQEPAAEVKLLELQRLDALLHALWPQAMAGKPHVTDRCLAIMDRRAKYLGLDAPAKIDIEARIRLMAESLGLDPDAAVAEAQRVIQEQQRARTH